MGSNWPHPGTAEDRERESLLAAIVASASRAVIALDLNGIVTAWNDAAERWFGYPESEIAGRNLAGLLPSGQAGQLAAVLARVGQGEALSRYPAKIICRDGTPVEATLAIWGIRDRSGRVNGAAAITVDVTEEERLRSHLAAIVASSDEAIIGADFGGIITSWNRGAERLFGYPAEEIIGHSAEELAGPGGPDARAVIERLQRGEAVRNIAAGIRRKDGTTADAWMSLSPIRHHGGLVTGMAAVLRELSEADRLRSQLAAIVESSPDAILGLDLDGTITSWNPGAQRMYGYTADEMIGHNVIELTIGDAPDPDLVTGLLQRGERQQQFEALIARKDGTAVNVSVSVTPIRDAGGAIIGTAATGRELTEEEQLRSRLAAIVKSSSDAILGLDLDGTITSWNPGAERMYGCSADEMAGRSMLELIPPGKQLDLDALAGALRRGEPVPDYETRTLRKDGTTVAGSVSLAAIRDCNGALTGTAVVARDITERVRTEAERRAAEERKHEAERIETVGQLAGRVAHDFNNLLSAIMGYGGLVADATADTPEVRADVEQILDAARRASRLSRELLLISRREPVRVEALDLNRTLSDLRDLLAASVGEHITLRFQTAAVPTVLADRGRLEQVVLNLAVNARDAMPGGGTLTFATRTVTRDEPPGGGASLCPAAELTVSDTGCGMSPEVARRAFEPFFTTKPPEEGTGLGLSTVHSLVTEAGGSITVESAEGTGTTFRVRLPLTDLSPTEGTRNGAQAGRGHGERVLVVDDEPGVLEVTARTLGRSGYTTLQASTADEALSLLAAHDIQLLLADTVMPGMPGTTLAACARERKPGLRVLHMSGYLPPSQQSQLGDFLPKPFTAATLLAKVREVLDTPPATGDQADPAGNG